ncbi:hypothetical protein BHM03_00060971 [Ensete ventricosum]|uniref:Uncharacterized protein n=1 Tax=Ensete ventricosum TaxID=4639 RepID=A0A426Z3J8_ENSVE|nr:hypothetical protein B296_00028779 [Ensete ventricosum]RZS27492.1 hypothetical protein BHM03_00060971 [Ensete ventricosum]
MHVRVTTQCSAIPCDPRRHGYRRCAIHARAAMPCGAMPCDPRWHGYDRYLSLVSYGKHPRRHVEASVVAVATSQETLP